MLGRGSAAPGKGGSAAGKGSAPPARAPVEKEPGPRLGPNIPPPTPGLSRGEKEPRQPPYGRQASPAGGAAPSLPPSRAGRCPPVTMTVRDSGCREGSPQSPPQQLSSMGAAILSAARPRCPRQGAPQRQRPGRAEGPEWSRAERSGVADPGNPPPASGGHRVTEFVGWDNASESSPPSSGRTTCQPDSGAKWHTRIFLERSSRDGDCPSSLGSPFC